MSNWFDIFWTFIFGGEGDRVSPFSFKLDLIFFWGGGLIFRCPPPPLNTEPEAEVKAMFSDFLFSKMGIVWGVTSIFGTFFSSFENYHDDNNDFFLYHFFFIFELNSLSPILSFMPIRLFPLPIPTSVGYIVHIHFQ